MSYEFRPPEKTMTLRNRSLMSLIPDLCQAPPGTFFFLLGLPRHVIVCILTSARVKCGHAIPVASALVPTFTSLLRCNMPPTTPTPTGSQLALMKEAADLRAQGNSWQAIANRIGRKERCLRYWRDVYPRLWR